jgi:hypothetical protein
MLPQLLSLVLLVGLTAGLRRCFPRLGGGFGAAYGLSAALLLPVVAAYLRLGQLGVTAHATDLSFLFNAAPLYGRNLLGLALPRAAGLPAVFPWPCPVPPSATTWSPSRPARNRSVSYTAFAAGRARSPVYSLTLRNNLTLSLPRAAF